MTTTTTTPETPTPEPSKYSTEWAKDTADRVISTGAQAAIATLTAHATGLVDIDWVAIGSIVGLSMLVSALKALAVAQR